MTARYLLEANEPMNLHLIISVSGMDAVREVADTIRDAAAKLGGLLPSLLPNWLLKFANPRK